MKNRFCKKLATIVVALLSLAGGLQAQPISQKAQTTPQSEKPQFANDRVLVKLANTPAMRSTTAVPGVAYSAPNLGVAYSEVRLLNPSKGNANLRSFSTMRANDTQNNVYVLMLEEQGEQAVRRALEILNTNPAVEIAEPAFYYQLYATPNDPMFSQQYALQKINAPAAWNITTGSKNVVVGIIDSGIDGTHPDLKDNLWVNPNPNRDGFVNDINGYDFVNAKGGIPTDTGEHGTHVSGIVGAKGNNGTGVSGINWNVSLAWLGVGLAGGQYISLGAVIEALNYANNHNIQITNNSYGGPNYSAIFEDAIRNYNGLFVAAAGNSRSNNDINPSYPASYNLPNVVSVASTDQYDNLSYFSNYGANSVHIAAPGSDILSTVPNGRYEAFSGTSMASPYVAGVAALIKSVKPDLSPAQLKEILIATARHSNSLDGFGIVDAYAVLTAVSNDHLSSKIDLSQSDPAPAGLGWVFSEDVYIISGGTHISITGNNSDSERRVEVLAGATVSITLDNASITGLVANQSPLLLNNDANVKLTLIGTNTLTAGSGSAGIQAPQGTTLKIGGIGSLTATGATNGAGIGGGNNGAGGNITIGDGAVVTVTGGLNAQGIGRGSGSGTTGTFAINGNAVVMANSVGDTNESSRAGGILFDGNTGTFYGKSVTISSDVTIPANLTIPENYILTIPEGTILTIPEGIMLTNNGTIINDGVINIDGTLMNNNMIVNLGTINGMVTGNPTLPDFPYSDIDLSNNNPFPRGVGWIFSGNIYTVLDGANVTIKGTSANNRRIEVEVNATASITLKGVTIRIGGISQSSLLLNNGANLTLTLEETNILKGADVAGIEVPHGTTLMIDGTGSLEAIGGGGCAGIGSAKCGDITINGGIITATGNFAAGIGSGFDWYAEGGNITINGGIVTATGDDYGDGIGSGFRGSAGTFTMSGNAIVFANKVGDMDTDRKTGGILVVGNSTYWYGDNNFSLSHNVTVPSNNVLTIGKDKTLTIPSGTILTNKGMIINYAEITINGTLMNTGKIIDFGTINGIVTGNNPTTVIPRDNNINLGAGTPVVPVGDGWIYANSIYTILDGADVTITGRNASQRRIEITAGATANITLNSVSITGLGEYKSPLLLNTGAVANLTIEGQNTLKAGEGCAGIQTTNATIIIDGTGSLTATGGNRYGAGIGGGRFRSGGKITINGGTITATAVNSSTLGIVTTSSGIGDGDFGEEDSGNDITINGGVVTAIGATFYDWDCWEGGAGIGGYYDNCKLTMDGNAIVFASSLRVTCPFYGVLETNINGVVRGILFDGNSGKFYGNNVTIDQNVTIPAERILTVPASATLTIPAGLTLTNKGTVYKAGTINHGGEYGVWAGNPYIVQGTSLPNISLNETIVFMKGGDLFVDSPVSETISIYSANGILIDSKTKQKGAITFSTEYIPNQVLIIKGSSGWVRKIAK
ncbi:MAG: S8 family serine peptidase [Dysgonamonadaceae bacterium]|jgi:subtilisin family serine protease|nr:S8 family serine peptidase [Dysgonamonadaceae bacterium]